MALPRNDRWLITHYRKNNKVTGVRVGEYHFKIDHENDKRVLHTQKYTKLLLLLRHDSIIRREYEDAHELAQISVNAGINDILEYVDS